MAEKYYPMVGWRTPPLPLQVIKGMAIYGGSIMTALIELREFLVRVSM